MISESNQVVVDDECPTISVITVVFNDVRNIEKTIKSIINQTFSKIEYIIIDGGSTDGTLETIKRYRDYIDILVSEPDAGIYDAMNKGVALAKGDFLSFMNSGDEFFSSDTIKLLVPEIDQADVIYGSTEVYEASGQKRNFSPGYPPKFYYNLPFNHQSVFVKTEVHRKYIYDTRFRVYADLLLFHQLLKDGYEFKRIETVVAKYDATGISATVTKSLLNERYRAGNIIHGKALNILLFSTFALRRLAKDLGSRFQGRGQN